MTPDQTQEILRLIAAIWPRNPISEDTIDAWAIALTPIDPHIAKQAVIEHSRSPEGQWPPSVAEISAAMRAAQRNIRPADRMLENIKTSAQTAARDRETAKARVNSCANSVGMPAWQTALDEARRQLIAEYGHPHIPVALVAGRACTIVENDLAEQDTPF